MARDQEVKERPDQWYWDALDRNHAREARIAIILGLLPLAAGIIALVCLVVIAVKM